MAESTPENSSYPGQQAKTLYAQKINHRRRAPRSEQRKRGGHKTILLWAGAVVLLWLLLRLL